ncbi:MAG: tetratricopeptide repeat protein [Desulfobacula sp.]|nr:tetratricopeptide repeat protein [Desulfobacula sp.]
MILKQIFKLSSILLCLVFFVSGCSCDTVISYEEKGNRAFEEKSYKLAIQYWMKSLDEGSDKFGLYHKLGKAYFKTARIDLAKNYLEKALKIKPLDHETQKDLVRILLLKGETRAAQKQMAQLKDKVEKDANFFILYGDLFMVSNDFQKAEPMYRKAATLEETNIRITIKLAMCLHQSGSSNETEKLISGIGKSRMLAPLDLLLLSDYYFLIQDFTTAETCIIEAMEKNPDNRMVKIRLFQFYLKTDMKDKALKSLLGLEGEYPNDGWFKLMLTDLFLSRMEVDRAEQMLKKIKSMKKLGPDYDLLMGKVYLFKGKIPYAVSYLKNVIDERPGLLSAHYLLGVAYFAGGQTKLAENSFINALILNPNHVKTLLVLAGLHYKNKEFKLALQYLEKAIFLEPHNARAYMTKGLCLMEQNKGEDASHEFYKAYSLLENVSPLFFLAQSFQSQGKYDIALDIYEDVIDKRPELVDALHMYTSLLLDLKQNEKAMAIIEKVIKTEPYHPVVYYIAARVSLTFGDYKKAKTYLKTAMTHENVPGYIYRLLAVVHQKSGANSSVEEILKQCIEKNPSYVNAWIDLADLYARTGENSLAIETLNQALERFPENPSVSGNLAWLLVENENDFDRALNLARIAYEKSPDKAYLMDTLGWAYFHKKAFSQAEWMLASAEKLAPDKGIIKYHQGMVFYKQRKLLEAKDKLKLALKYDLSDKDINKLKQVLADLETEKTNKIFEGGGIFDPEAPLSFPSAPREEENILEPDWSQTNRKAVNQ